MTLLKRKPTPPGWRTRARAAVASHPRIAWGTLAAIVGILGVIVPGLFWLVGLLETRDHADAHNKVDRRADAWIIFGQADMRELVLDKWTSDCVIAMEQAKGTVSAFQRSVCTDYASKLQTAKTRAEQARTDAQALSK